VGVIYEVVSNVPKASEQLEDRESLAAMAASGQDEITVDGETFIEKYTKGAAAVDEILRMEKIRQSVAIKEILVVRNKNQTPVQSMRKTLSVPNISNVMRNSFSLDNVSGLRLKSSETFQELSLELSGRSPRSFASTQSNEYTQSHSNTKLL
jgi:kinesin family protein 13